MRRFETLVNMALVVPLGVGATLIEDVPKVIARGRREVVLARFIGKMVVTHGLKEAQRRLAHTDDVSASVRDEAIEVAAAVTAVVEPAAAVMSEVGESAAGESAAGESGAGVSADDLVLPDYDHLPASHVVAKLASLDQAERDSIEQYETVHRNRRTILGKLDQLRNG